MNRRTSLVAIATISALLASGCSTTGRGPSADPAAERRSIDAAAETALSKLHAQVPQSKALTSQAKGVLVFPSVVSAGLIVGGSYGKGALMVDGQTAAYYSTTAGSVGLLAGAQSKAVYVLFMTQESLDKFRASKGWTAGADASVAMLDVGANANVSTKTIQQPIVGYVLTNAGLMADLSVDGTKFTRLDL